MHALERNTVTLGIKIGRKLLVLFIFIFLYLVSAKSITKSSIGNKWIFSVCYMTVRVVFAYFCQIKEGKNYITDSLWNSVRFFVIS